MQILLKIQILLPLAATKKDDAIDWNGIHLFTIRLFYFGNFLNL